MAEPTTEGKNIGDLLVGAIKGVVEQRAIPISDEQQRVDRVVSQFKDLVFSGDNSLTKRIDDQIEQSTLPQEDKDAAREVWLGIERVITDSARKTSRQLEEKKVILQGAGVAITAEAVKTIFLLQVITDLEAHQALAKSQQPEGAEPKPTKFSVNAPQLGWVGDQLATAFLR